MRSLRVAALVSLVLLAACPQKTAVWVQPGSTADDLTLIFGRERGKERPISVFLRIDRCEDRGADPFAGTEYWNGSIAGSRLVYGRTSDAADLRNARPLTPGCYLVATSGSGRTAFVVDSAGGVTEVPVPPPLDEPADSADDTR